jgi:hypothetical protein
MGLNRSSPLPYALSAQKVLDARPDWVLAEHGSAMEFSAEDFRRRVEWGKVSAQAADALCVSGNHRADWDPHRVHVEPILHKAKPGATLAAKLVATNVLAQPQKLRVVLEGRNLTPEQAWDLDIPAGATVSRDIKVRLSDTTGAGRNVIALRIEDPGRSDASDAFLAVDIEP